MLLQLRVTVPPDRTGRVRALFEEAPGTAHLAVLAGASLVPPGDLMLVDVARESADGLVAALRELDVDSDGAICMEAVDAAVSRTAARAEEAAPGEGADAVVWEQVVQTTAADSSLSVAYLLFLTISTLISAVAIINDSAILVIGAMVLGPEFGPLAGLAVAAVHRRHALARSAARALVGGFVLAILATAFAAVIGRWLGWFGTELLARERPQTGFITAPDRWSVVVAVLAGVAGVLSLTSAKSEALVGVFISVTTVPAAADMALSLSLGAGGELGRAALQLGINLAGILAGATATMALQKVVWHRVPRVVPRFEGLSRTRLRG